MIGFIIFPSYLGVDLSFLSLLFGTIVSVVGRKTKHTFFVSKDVGIFWTFIFLIWLLTILFYFINGAVGISTQFMFKPPRLILISVCITIIFSLSDLKYSNVISIILLSALINAVVVYLQYILHFLGISDSFLLNPNVGANISTPFRKAGLMAGFPIAGLLSVLGALCALYMYSGFRKRRYIFLAIFIALTCFLTARTALYLCIVFFGFYFSYVIMKKRDALIGFISILSIFSLIIFISTSDNRIIRGTVDKMFANIINYTETGSALDYSTRDLLQNHYTFPTSEYVFTFGTSLDNRSSDVNSDVSVFRITWYSGFITAILYISAFVFVILSSVLRANSSREILFISCFMLTLVIANFKGSYLFSRVLGDSMLLLWLAKLILSSDRNKIVVIKKQ